MRSFSRRRVITPVGKIMGPSTIIVGGLCVLTPNQAQAV